MVRSIAERTLDNGTDAKRFKPVIGHMPNLIDVGFEGKHAAVPCNVALCSILQKKLTRALILLGRSSLSNDKVNQIIEGYTTMSTSLVKLCFKGKTGWDTKLASKTTISVISQEQQSVVPSEDSEKREMHIVQCPACHKQSPSERYRFQYKDLDIKIKCSVCLKSTPIRGWNCNCGVLWYNCKVHSCTKNNLPKAEGKPRSSGSIEATPLVDKLIENSSYEDLLDDDLRREAKRAKKTSEQADSSSRQQVTRFTANMLSPNLRLRFPHLH